MSNPIAEAIREALEEVVKTYIGIVPNLQQTIVRKDEDSTALGDISAVIGLTGEKVSGVFVVSFKKELIFHFIRSLFGEEPKEINQEVLDAAGEISNMICGSFRRRLENFGPSLKASVPSMVTGENHRIHSLCKSPRLSFIYRVNESFLIVEFCLDKVG
ncbi:MAG: chemotaxis protein CheX [Thermodesulfobacteriaceae bacterium]|nr:chemotaxis protein CheX [Thermodesulfobacteriaceae bacterium]MCX8041071.1 chemotaxis protein CheX [Thermodesulfobacteriaceae bacterium]MDW8135512.1 chemotaxis protein CheX [Thermodesulfobacterium sp.]